MSDQSFTIRVVFSHFFFLKTKLLNKFLCAVSISETSCVHRISVNIILILVLMRIASRTEVLVLGVRMESPDMFGSDNSESIESGDSCSVFQCAQKREVNEFTEPLEAYVESLPVRTTPSYDDLHSDVAEINKIWNKLSASDFLTSSSINIDLLDRELRANKRSYDDLVLLVDKLQHLLTLREPMIHQTDAMPLYSNCRIALESQCFKFEKLLHAKARSIDLQSKLIASMLDEKDEYLRLFKQ